MRRVYTDNRFPEYEIVNHGQPVFEVIKNGSVVSTFESWDRPDGTISESCAQRRALDFYDRLGQQPPLVIESTAGNRVTSMDIDRCLNRLCLESNLKRRQELRQRAFSLMQREEPLAEAVVNHLIEGT